MAQSRHTVGTKEHRLAPIYLRLEQFKNGKMNRTSQSIDITLSRNNSDTSHALYESY
jgi:hypothetical protein